MWQARRREMYRGFWQENPKARDHLEDMGADEIMILTWILKT
jgi:hypothetical protein